MMGMRSRSRRSSSSQRLRVHAVRTQLSAFLLRIHRCRFYSLAGIFSSFLCLSGTNSFFSGPV